MCALELGWGKFQAQDVWSLARSELFGMNITHYLNISPHLQTIRLIEL